MADVRRAGPSGPASASCSHPMFEDARLFRRGIGDDSDVVRKEMYEFDDRGGRRPGAAARGHRPDGAGLRPAPPAGAVEGVVRHARPSATSGPRPGRYRQHHQLGVEVLGTDDPDLDVEVVALAAGLLRRSGAAPGRPGGQLHGLRRVPRPATSAALRAYPRRAPPTSCATSTASATGPTRCGSSTASARSAGR